MKDDLICPICGEKTRIYMGNARKDRLCGNHADQLKSNLIELNDEGIYVNCKTKKDSNKVSINTVLKHESVNKCNICGEDSEKYELCYDCYRKKTETQQTQYTKISQEDMTAFIESEKDSGIDIRKKWQAKIRCEDGHYVRSHAECRIDEWLRNHNIQHDYEKIVISKADHSKFLLCDFYIPDAKLYIEFWGYKDKATYIKRRAEKVAIYQENGLQWEDMEDYHLEALGDAMTQIMIKYFPDLEDIKK